MGSRVDSNSSLQSRISRNARLYEEVYDSHGDLENLPLADNTKDTDINKLKELISDMNDKKTDNDISLKYDDSFWENKKRNIDDEKIHDINKLLEKARYENVKLKDSDNDLLKSTRNILSKLDVDDIHDIEENNNYSSYEDEEVVHDKLEMTRELKYRDKQKEADSLIDNVMPDNDLAMDLFFDLKPTGDTIVTDPIKNTNTISTKEIDTRELSDTSDIDIIKKDVSGIDRDFFTSSYEFSDKDFSDDEDLFDDNRGSGIFKIILLIIGVILLVGVIVYFVINFGIGA